MTEQSSRPERTYLTTAASRRSRTRALVGAGGVTVALIWLFFQLPAEIPIHLTLSSKPDMYGPSWTLFILMAIFVGLIGRGDLTPAESALTASHHEYNPSCGDEIELSIAVDPATGDVSQLAWNGQGCSISMASASVLSQLVRDERLTMEEAQGRIDAFREMIQSRGESEPDEDLLGDAVAFQGVSKFVMRVKCAMLAWVALEADLRQVEAQR